MPKLFNVEVVKLALGAMYREDRFLGEFKFKHQESKYVDINHGDYKNFEGREEIVFEKQLVYELRYFGGLIQK